MKKTLLWNLIILLFATDTCWGLAAPSSFHLSRPKSSSSEASALFFSSPQFSEISIEEIENLKEGLIFEENNTEAAKPYKLIKKDDKELPSEKFRFGKTDAALFLPSTSMKNKPFRAKLKIFGSRFQYYAGYFISTFVFDLLIILVLILFTTTSGALPVNAPIAFAILFVIRIFFPGLDSAITENTKINLKGRISKTIEEQNKKYLCSQFGLQRKFLEDLLKRKAIDKNSAQAINRFLKHIENHGNNHIPTNEAQTLQLVLDWQQKNNLSLNQTLILLNILNQLLFSGRDMHEYYKTHSSYSIRKLLNSPTTTSKGLSMLERYILINTYAISSVETKRDREQFVTFLLEHHSLKADISNVMELCYRSGLKKIFQYYIISSYEIGQFSFYMHEVFEDDGRISALRSFLDMLSTIRPWPRELRKRIIHHAREITKLPPVWLAHLYTKNGAPTQELLKIYKNCKHWAKDQNHSIWNTKKLVVDVIASHQPMGESYNAEILEYLFDEVYELDNPSDDSAVDEKNAFVLKVLFSISKAYLNKSTRTTASEEDKAIVIQKLEKFLSKNTHREHFVEILPRIQSLRDAVQMTSYGDPLFMSFSHKVTQTNGTQERKTAYDFQQQQDFYFSFFFTLGAILIPGLILAFFFNPVFSIPFPFVIIVILFTLVETYLQVLKGQAHRRAYIHALGDNPRLYYTEVYNVLKELEKDKVFKHTPPSYKTETTIFKAFEKAFSRVNINPSLNDWRAFYVQAINKTKNGLILASSLAKFALLLKNKPYLTSKANLLDLNKQIIDIMRQDNIDQSQQVHYYNMINPKYVLNIEKFFPKDNPNISHFEMDAIKMECKDLVYQLKFAHFLAAVFHEPLTSHKTRERISHHFLRQTKYHYGHKDLKDITLHKTYIFILGTFLNSNSKDIWQPLLDQLTNYIFDKSPTDGTFFVPVLKKMYLNTNRADYLLNKIEQSASEPEKQKTLLYTFSNTPNFNKEKKSWIYRLPKFFYIRFAGYSVFFLILFALTVCTLNFTYHSLLRLSITITAFIVPLFFVNLISLISRFEKDIQQAVFDDKVYLTDIKDIHHINTRKLKHKRSYNNFLKIFKNYEEWKSKTYTKSFVAKKDKLYTEFIKAQKSIPADASKAQIFKSQSEQGSFLNKAA